MFGWLASLINSKLDEEVERDFRRLELKAKVEALQERSRENSALYKEYHDVASLFDFILELPGCPSEVLLPKRWTNRISARTKAYDRLERTPLAEIMKRKEGQYHICGIPVNPHGGHEIEVLYDEDYDAVR